MEGSLVPQKVQERLAVAEGEKGQELPPRVQIGIRAQTGLGRTAGVLRAWREQEAFDSTTTTSTPINCCSDSTVALLYIRPSSRHSCDLTLVFQHPSHLSHHGMPTSLFAHRRLQSTFVLAGNCCASVYRRTNPFESFGKGCNERPSIG